VDARPNIDPEAVLQHADWMHALALSLLGDPATVRSS